MIAGSAASPAPVVPQENRHKIRVGRGAGGTVAWSEVEIGLLRRRWSLATEEQALVGRGQGI